MKRMFAFGFALAVAAAATVAVQAADWGTGFNDFRDTCAALDGELNGNGFGSTCAYGGEIVNVPGGSRGWTVDIAFSTVATWQGGSNVTEEAGAGVVIACYNPGGVNMRLSHQHCVPR